MENLPFLAQWLILGIVLFALPAVVGYGLQGMKQNKGIGESGLLFWWISGQMVLWAVFQLVCVPFVLLEKDVDYVVKVFGMLAGLLAFWGVLCRIVQSRRGKLRLLESQHVKTGWSAERIGWIIFAAILIFQLIQAVRLAYGDGDDAYYVAVSTIAEDSGMMYRKLPYTGGTTNVDIRHGLAPFPIWITFLAMISGMKVVGVAHVAVPLMLIPMTYGIFCLIGKKLFEGKRKQLPYFMILTEFLVLFGDYSFYTAERFMIARSRQGKAALGSIVLPMLLFVMLLFLNYLQEKQKIAWQFWGLLCSVMLAGCLCSTMGAFLLCMMVAVTGLCAVVGYGRWKLLLPLALCCVPCVGYMLLYVLN